MNLTLCQKEVKEDIRYKGWRKSKVEEMYVINNEKGVHRIVGNCTEFCKLTCSDHLMTQLIVYCLVDLKKIDDALSEVAFDTEQFWTYCPKSRE